MEVTAMKAVRFRLHGGLAALIAAMPLSYVHAQTSQPPHPQRPADHSASKTAAAPARPDTSGNGISLNQAPPAGQLAGQPATKAGDTITAPLTVGSAASPTFFTLFANPGGGYATPTGNNVSKLDVVNSHFNFMKQITEGVHADPVAYFNYDLMSKDFKPYYPSGEYADQAGVLIQGTSHPGSTGQVNALKILLRSAGNNPFNSQDQTLNLQTQKYGQNSVWNRNEEIYDWTGSYPDSFASVVAESDIAADGPDQVDCHHDPFYCSRTVYYLAGAPLSAYPTKLLRNTSYPSLTAGPVGSPVVVTKASHSGALNTYILVKPGTTGSADVAYPDIANATVHEAAAAGSTTLSLNTTSGLMPMEGISGGGEHTIGLSNGTTIAAVMDGTHVKLSKPVNSRGVAAGATLRLAPVVQDGTSSWMFGAAIHEFKIGRGIWLESNPGTANQFEYESGIATDARFDNAFIDTQNATLTGEHAAIWRMAADQPIDFTGNKTEAGKNRHTLEYSTHIPEKGLTYANQNGVAFTVDDANYTNILGPALLAGGPLANVAGRTSGYPKAGLTVAANVSNRRGEADMVVPESGLNVFVADNAGNISKPALSVEPSHVAVDAPTTISGNLTAKSLTVGTTPVTPNLTGTSAAIGGDALKAGQCASGTAAVAGASTSMAVVASPATFPGDGTIWQAYVSAPNTVTVKLCAIVDARPSAAAYNVRVLQ
jgi:hypothetical protein